VCLPPHALRGFAITGRGRVRGEQKYPSHATRHPRFAFSWFPKRGRRLHCTLKLAPPGLAGKRRRECLRVVGGGGTITKRGTHSPSYHKRRTCPVVAVVRRPVPQRAEQNTMGAAQRPRRSLLAVGIVALSLGGARGPFTVMRLGFMVIGSKVPGFQV